jgi:hypothetical protein
MRGLERIVTREPKRPSEISRTADGLLRSPFRDWAFPPVISVAVFMAGAETYLGPCLEKADHSQRSRKTRPYDMADMKIAANAEKQLAGSGWLLALLWGKGAV